jgi:hypothetical protein
MNFDDHLVPSPADIQQARQYVQLVVRMLEQSQWLEERRDDAIRTLRYVNFYLGDRN